jgi:hypothetical protein
MRQQKTYFAMGLINRSRDTAATLRRHRTRAFHRWENGLSYHVRLYFSRTAEGRDHPVAGALLWNHKVRNHQNTL